MKKQQASRQQPKIGGIKSSTRSNPAHKEQLKQTALLTGFQAFLEISKFLDCQDVMIGC